MRCHNNKSDNNDDKQRFERWIQSNFRKLHNFLFFHNGKTILKLQSINLIKAKNGEISLLSVFSKDTCSTLQLFTLIKANFS